MHKTLRPAPGRAKRLPHGHPSHVLPAVGAVDLRKAALRQAFAAALVLGLVALMWDRVEQLDFAHIRASLKTVSPWQWLAACGLTALSFWGLGRYDGVVHRLLGTPASKSQAEQAGIAAIAISQTVGLGVISATFVRWRM